MSSLSVGDLVFRVVEYDRRDDKDHTWIVAERTVRKIRKDGKIELDHPFPGTARIINNNGLPRTRSAAIAEFNARQAREIETAQRKLDVARRASSWAAEASLLEAP